MPGHRIGPFRGASAIVVELIAFAVVMLSSGTAMGLVPIAASGRRVPLHAAHPAATHPGRRLDEPAEWHGLRSFLKDFSRLYEACPAT